MLGCRFRFRKQTETGDKSPPFACQSKRLVFFGSAAAAAVVIAALVAAAAETAAAEQKDENDDDPKAAHVVSAEHVRFPSPHNGVTARNGSVRRAVHSKLSFAAARLSVGRLCHTMPEARPW